MKKKVIGLCTLLLVLLLGCCTNSYANFDINVLESQLETLKAKGLISTTPKEANASYWQSIVSYSTYQDNIWNFNYDGYFIIVTNNTGEMANRLIICLHKSSNGNIVNYTNDVNNSFYNMWGSYNSQFGIQSESQAFSFNFNGTNSIEGIFKYNIINYKYVYTMFDINTRGLVLNAFQEYGGNYLTSSFEFNLATVRTIPVTYNNVTETFYKFNYSRSVGSWMLGHFTADSGDLVQIKLYRFLNDEYTDFFAGSDKKGDYINNYGLGITYDNYVFVNNAQLYYNQGYKLMIDLNGETVDSYLIYFLPYSSSATSGDLISPDVDTNSDLKIIQSIEDLVDPQEVDNVYDEYFEKPSGELLGLLGYDDYNNYYSDYIHSLFTQLQVALDGTEGVSFTFPFMGRNITIYSIDFITPPGLLKIFVSSFLVFAFGYFVYCQYMHFFHQLQEGNLFAAVDTFSVNDESILM